MKHILRFVLCLTFVALVVLALPMHANAAGLPVQPQAQKYSDKLVFGDTFTLGPDDILNGNLTIFGGSVTLEKGSQVNGDVVILGGTLNADDEISGNVGSLGGSLFLGDNVVIQGNLSMLGGSLHRSGLAQIKGQVINGGFGPLNLSLPHWPFDFNFWSGFQPFFNLFSTLLNAVVLAALAILVVLLWPRPTGRIARAVGTQPVISGGLGLLTIIVVPALMVLLLITIILIPVSILGFLLLGIAGLYGWFAVGLEVGNRIAQMFKQEWQPALTAGLGTLVISLIASFIGAVPCVGWLVPFLIVLIGLGSVIITRFGTQLYPPLSPAAGSGPVTIQPYNPAAPQAPYSPAAPQGSQPDGTTTPGNSSDIIETKPLS